MVDRTSHTLELQSNPLPSPTDYNRIRRLGFRMGSSMWRSEDWRAMVGPGIVATYKCKGVAGCLYSSSNLYKGPEEQSCTSQGRQHNSHVLHQSHGRNTLTNLAEHCKTTVGMESGKEPCPLGRAPPGQIEHNSRSGVQVEERFLRVDVGSSGFQDGDGSSRSMSGRPFCIKAIQATQHVHELETGPRCSGSGRPVAVMEPDKGVCIPTILPDREMLGKGEAREGQGASADSSNLAHTSMVSHATSSMHSQPSQATRREEPAEESLGGTTPADGERRSTTSRMVCIRNSLKNRGISEEATTIILASWRKSTEAAYSCIWKKWEGWCIQQDLNPLCAPLSAILNFLAEGFSQGKKYRTLSSYRSAISMTHCPIDGVVVGKHPLVSRLLRGIFNSRPPQPKYLSTWDVDAVLSYLRNQGCNSALSLKQLTLKLAMLLALANASRSSEIHALSTEHMVRSTHGVKFQLHELTKTARPGKPNSELHFSYFLEDPSLCPVVTLEKYIEVTRDLRAAPNRQQLFLSYVRPHDPVTTCTIARWLKATLKDAGVGQQFKAHSVQGAAVSAAHLRGMSVADIMKMANWSSDHMFKKHYFRQVTAGDNPSLFHVLH